MKKIKKILWTIYFFLFCKPFSLYQFKIFCTKIELMSQSEWEEYEQFIFNNETLFKFFKLNKASK